MENVEAVPFTCSPDSCIIVTGVPCRAMLSTFIAIDLPLAFSAYIQYTL